MSLTIKELHDQLDGFSELEEGVTLSEVDHFIRLVSHFTKEIKLYAPPNSDDPPVCLPKHLQDLCTSCLGLGDLSTTQLWDALKEVIWITPSSDLNPLSKTECQYIDGHGIKTSVSNEKLASVMFYPPMTCFVCRSALNPNTLSRHEIVLFTLNDGAQHGLSSALSCNNCNIQYYHNYYTRGNARHYYKLSDPVPWPIQIDSHTFVSVELCEFITYASQFAQVSANNSANIYNHCFSHLGDRKNKSARYMPLMSAEQVSRAFTLYALLRDCGKQGLCTNLVRNPGPQINSKYQMTFSNPHPTSSNENNLFDPNYNSNENHWRSSGESSTRHQENFFLTTSSIRRSCTTIVLTEPGINDNKKGICHRAKVYKK